MQDVDQLWHGVALLHDDFAGPVGQHLVAVLHAGGYSWGQDGHGLSDDGSSLHGVSFQEAVEDLEREDDTFLMILTFSCTIHAFSLMQGCGDFVYWQLVASKLGLGN